MEKIIRTNNGIVVDVNVFHSGSADCSRFEIARNFGPFKRFHLFFGHSLVKNQSFRKFRSL